MTAIRRAEIAAVLCAIEFFLLLLWVLLVRFEYVSLPTSTSWSRFFIDTIPALWRYERFFVSQGRELEFVRVFTLHLPFVLLQILVLPIIVFLSTIKVSDLFRRGVEVSPRQELLFFLLVSGIFLFQFLVLFGSYNIAFPDVTNRIVIGSYSTYYRYVAVLPFTNLLLFILLRLRRFQVSVSVENEKRAARPPML